MQTVEYKVVTGGSVKVKDPKYPSGIKVAWGYILKYYKDGVHLWDDGFAFVAYNDSLTTPPPEVAIKAAAMAAAIQARRNVIPPTPTPVPIPSPEPSPGPGPSPNPWDEGGDGGWTPVVVTEGGGGTYAGWEGVGGGWAAGAWEYPSMWFEATTAWGAETGAWNYASAWTGFESSGGWDYGGTWGASEAGGGWFSKLADWFSALFG